MASELRTEFVEAIPDSIEVMKVNLPDGRALKQYTFGLENTIEDEIENLILKKLLQGKPGHYMMRYVTSQSAKVLNREKKVEFYLNDLVKSCTIYIERRSSPPET